MEYRQPTTSSATIPVRIDSYGNSDYLRLIILVVINLVGEEITECSATIMRVGDSAIVFSVSGAILRRSHNFH